ncbi:MAG TPA: PmoA family protein [Chthonomonadaceae bacterium]|nr:PmoA family protein [Chthonomonadaceae bacterium]
MVEIIEESGQLVVRVGGQEYARYQYGPANWKPYLYPLRAANGAPLLANAPVDHRNHHGIWFGHGRVDDYDFWLERLGAGRIAHKKFENLTGGGEVGSFTEQCEWIAPSGSVVLTDTRTFTFYETPPEARVFDIEIVLRAPAQTTVTLSPTNEAGLPCIRPAEGLAVRSGGVLTNSEGKHSEKEVRGQRAAWLDSSGKLGKHACGIAVFDHPQNPDYPTPWFARDYGPFAPNAALYAEEPILLSPRKPLRLRYRVYTHSGDVTEGRVRDAWEEYRDSAQRGDGPADKADRALGVGR